MQKHKLVNNNGTLILLSNDAPCRCPFTSPAVIFTPSTIKGAAPTQQLVGQNCMSDCPHFLATPESEINGGKVGVMLTCGTNRKLITIEEVIQDNGEAPGEKQSPLIKV